MEFLGQDPVRCKKIVNNKCLQPRKNFKHTGFEMFIFKYKGYSKITIKTFSNTGNYKQQF